MLRLYQTPFSTNVERVALALGHKGLEAEPVLVPDDDRSVVREASGQDLVPVLEDEGMVVVDSMEIVQHLEARFPDPPLYPQEPSRRVETLLFTEWFNEVWKRPPNAIATELESPTPDHARIGFLAARMSTSLGWFEDLLDGRDYLLGDFGAADVAAFPFLKYALERDPEDDELFHRVLEQHQPLGDAHPSLADWIRRVDAHPRAGLA